jgi:hypothetical protein
MLLRCAVKNLGILIPPLIQQCRCHQRWQGWLRAGKG